MTADPLSALISWAAAGGVAGLLGVALLERLVPILPSYGLLVAIGVAAAGGAWSVPAALLASTVGGFVGCFVFYALAVALGESRSIVVVRWTARLIGVSPSRVDRLTGHFRTHQGALAFGSQLVPTVRLVAPAVAGLLRAEVKRFAVASVCGIALWNGVFIVVGYAAAFATATTNVSALTLWILAILVVGEGFAVAIWRKIRCRTIHRSPPSAIMPTKED
jgi:membrane protein DedA with SNARE-associated domain